MQSSDEIDPEIAARHKAVYDDLLNEIDGLDSEEDDEPPQKPAAKPVAKPAPKNTSNAKKNKVEVEDEDADFPKFDDKAYNELQQGMKMKNDFDDLEKQIGNLESDEEEGQQSKKKPQKPASKESTPVVKQPPAQKPVTESVPKKVQESVQKPKEAAVAFPLSHFVGANTAALIAVDNKFHPKEYMMTKALVDYEIKQVIEPCLSSSAVSAEVKAHLEDKKNHLLKNKSKIDGLFKAGQLNAAKYMQVIAKMKTENIKIAQELQKNPNGAKEANRVKERLRVLLQEEKEYSEGGAVTQSTSSPASSKKLVSQGSSSHAMGNSGGIGAEIPSDLDNLPANQLLKILRKRKDQYYNLATYINREVLKVLDGNEAAQKKQYLQTSIIPLIQKAIHFIEALERDEEVEEARAFMKEDLEEVKPSLLHGKSLEERGEELKKLVEMLEVCLEEETDYVEKMRQTLSDPNQVMGPVGKKIKEGEKAIEKYAEYIEYLSRLESDKFMWEPTPKVSVSKEQRMISLMNKDIPGNSLLFKITKLDHIKARPYYIKWSIDAANGNETHNSSLCDGSSLKFNYQQMVQLCSKDKLDPSIENKEIKVEVLFTQLVFTKKKGEANIPLAPLKKTNHYEGKIKVRDDGIELHYVLQVREPLLKHIKVDVTTVHSFQKFPSFNRDAPVAQPNQGASQKKQATGPSPSHSQVNKNVAQEELKSNEPKPAAPSGGAAAGGGGGKLFEKKKYPPLVLLPQNPDPLAGVTQEDVPAGVALEQAMDPSNPDKVECLAVLKALAEELEKARVGLASEGRRNDNKIVGDNWGKALKNAGILEARFGNGDVEPAQYVETLKASIERDKKLIEFYKAKGDSNRSAFTEEKMKLTSGELAELEAALAESE